MKKMIFHIVLSVALFCTLSVLFTKSEDDIKAYNVREVSKESVIELTQGEDFKCVGKPVEILDMPKRVRAGDELCLTFKGEPYTEYSIKVYYPSGLSTSDELLPKKSNGKGNFGWELTVSPNAVEGRLRITVLSTESHLLTEIQIVD